jgi:hypothetical protein
MTGVTRQAQEQRLTLLELPTSDLNRSTDKQAKTKTKKAVTTKSKQMSILCSNVGRYQSNPSSP